MKYFFLASLLIALGCASHKKQEAPPPVATVTPTPTPQPTPTPDPHKVTCTHDKEIRELVVAEKGKGCILNFTKDGKNKVTASSSTGFKHCETAFAKQREKLEKSGFKCQ